MVHSGIRQLFTRSDRHSRVPARQELCCARGLQSASTPKLGIWRVRFGAAMTYWRSTTLPYPNMTNHGRNLVGARVRIRYIVWKLKFRNEHLPYFPE
jgi:hypothetical protein